MPASTSLMSASKARPTLWIASTASVNTLWPYGEQSTRVLGTAGLTMPKVGTAPPVSALARTPSGSTALPSASKHAVRISYAPPALKKCIWSWSTGRPRSKARVTKAHSRTPSASHERGTTMRAS